MSPHAGPVDPLITGGTLKVTAAKTYNMEVGVERRFIEHSFKQTTALVIVDPLINVVGNSFVLLHGSLILIELVAHFTLHLAC